MYISDGVCNDIISTRDKFVGIVSTVFVTILAIKKCFGTINFNGKSILKRSLNQFGPVVSKSEEKSR